LKLYNVQDPHAHIMCGFFSAAQPTSENVVFHFESVFWFWLHFTVYDGMQLESIVPSHLLARFLEHCSIAFTDFCIIL